MTLKYHSDAIVCYAAAFFKMDLFHYTTEDLKPFSSACTLKLVQIEFKMG